MKKQLRQLGDVSNMILDLKLASLQVVTQQADALQGENRQMKRAQQERAAQIVQADTPDLALFCGQDEAWSTWVKTQLHQRNLKLAKLYAEREERMDDARKAMGRAEVIKKLLRQQS